MGNLEDPTARRNAMKWKRQVYRNSVSIAGRGSSEETDEKKMSRRRKEKHQEV